MELLVFKTLEDTPKLEEFMAYTIRVIQKSILAD